MIEATFNASAFTVTAGPGQARTIAGTAVPFGVPGTVADGRSVIFEPGSIDAAQRPLLLRDHDRTRPLGRVIAASDLGDRIDATASVTRGTRDGDEALALAADGVLSALSVGVDPTEWYTDPDGVLHVTAGEWQELSLLTFGAYPTARVSTVHATQGELPMSDEPVPTETDDADPEEVVEPNPDIEPDEPTASVVPINAGSAARHPAAGRSNPGDAVTLRALGRLFTDARAGNRRAAQQLQATLGRYTVEAALADVTMVGANNVGSMYRPAYQPELLDIVNHGAPMTTVIRQGDLQRGDFPNKTFLTWTNTPAVALQSAEKGAVNSGPVSVAPSTVPVKTWATGNDIAQQVLDFGPPSFLEEYVRAAGASYAKTIDTYAVTALLAAATPVTTAASDAFIVVVQKLFAALNPANVPDGRLFLAVPWGVAAGLIGVTQQNGPAFWSMGVNLGNFLPADMSAGGLQVVVDANMPANTYLLGLTTAATWYDVPGTPFTLQAINVGQLGIDIAVYGYGALGVQWPLALVKTTPT